MQITTIVGNPKARSKTYTFASEASQAITQYVEQLTDEEITHHVIDLADYGVALVQWNQEVINTLIEQINASTYIIIASPTYKATYTGLLKLMLDLLPMNALQGKLVFPLMVGAGHQHQLAVELHMKPVLAELGAITTSRGLYLLDSQLDQCEHVMIEWVQQNSAVMKSLL